MILTIRGVCRRIARLIASAVALLYIWPWTAKAVEYEFTKIVDTDTAVPKPLSFTPIRRTQKRCWKS